MQVRVRYVELAHSVLRAKPRTRFGERVLTDAKSVRVRFAGRTFARPAGLLVFHSGRAGTHRLYVSANGHAARPTVLVE